MRRVRLPSLALAALGALVPAAGGCGGSPQKAGLRAYEAAIEDLMGQDGKVSVHIADVRKDIEAGNDPARQDERYARDEAIPFFEGFREKAGGLHPAEARLAAVHGLLLKYLDQRLLYLESTETALGVVRADDMVRFSTLQMGMRQAEEELKGKAAGRLDDREAIRVLGVFALFQRQKLDPLMRGQIARGEVARALQEELLPALEGLAERTKAALGGEGVTGALARWARAAADFHACLGPVLPRLEVLGRSTMAADDAWKTSLELREKFLSDLKSYRESVR